MLAPRFLRPLCAPKLGSGQRSLSDISVRIPSKVQGWPTPWITEEEATDYLFPLYSEGWYISAVKSELHNARAAGLSRLFIFPSNKPAAAFIRDVFVLADTENHHPYSLSLTNTTKRSTVDMCTTTHSALRPAWNAEDSPDTRKLEGLTLRDLRFAALVSSLPTYPGKPSEEFGPSPVRPTWEDLNATLRSWSSPLTKDAAGDVKKKTKSSCAACGGPHATRLCSTRHELTPPPCPICTGSHWRVDCPVRQEAERSNTSISKVRKQLQRRTFDGDLTPPPTPCPNCGGAHWKIDCRAPHAPAHLLERLKLPVPE
ncbi:hypothetical protein C8R43DRAFT_1118080 [Mycena crocata]|nr:hypothetical protein C8R43DRAFT_1118080 [Mycena crocata]